MFRWYDRFFFACVLLALLDNERADWHQAEDCRSSLGLALALQPVRVLLFVEAYRPIDLSVYVLLVVGRRLAWRRCDHTSVSRYRDLFFWPAGRALLDFKKFCMMRDEQKCNDHFGVVEALCKADEVVGSNGSFHLCRPALRHCLSSLGLHHRRCLRFAFAMSPGDRFPVPLQLT